MRPVILRPDDLAALARDMLTHEGALRLTARGASMAPAIRDGDVLDIVPAAPESLSVGDVVLYLTSDGRTVIHRVVAVEGRGGGARFVLRGDALPAAAEPVEGTHILGRVSHVQPRLARFVDRPVSALTGWSPSALERLQGMRLYRQLVRRAARGRITYRPLGQADRTAAVHFFGTARVLDTGLSAGPEAHALGAFFGKQPAGALLLVNYGVGTGLFAGWWIFDMQVRLRFRGAGIGERLLDHACQVACEHGADSLQLFVHVDNVRAVRLYTKHGFALASSPEWQARLDAEALLSGKQRIRVARVLRQHE